ncbi:putative Ig domain-containing protein [Catenuloplanes japonicus]|uniref:putative Ig domain-containing protein n=1 Tax=Catenuloplanes japonicus TaxID=33876 RepID=UPI000527D00A|nr:putative Ig domain-containing protein [Catenuloplanes japonicus]
MRAVIRRRTGPSAPAPDAGFTLVETIVAIGIIGLVMSALGTFFVQSMRASGKQTGTQAAAQMAGDAMERVRSLAGQQLALKRDQNSSLTQWQNPVPGVAPWLAGMTMAYDSTAAVGSGPTAQLPTTPMTVTLGGVDYRQSFYLGRCWQNLPAGGTCTTASGAYGFFRVVVAVNWNDSVCDKTGGVCSYVTATLVSNAEQEPKFDSNDQAMPPQIVPPGNQIDDVNSTVSLQLTATDGAAPLNWISADGLPSTMTMNTSGLISGRAPATAGTYTVTVTVQDDYDLVNTATFTWTVTRLPAAQSPGNQNTTGGNAITAVTLRVTDGSTPATWAATNLPPGLTLATATGVISGTPNKVGTYAVSATVTDKNQNTSTTSFSWVVPNLELTDPTVTRTLTYNQTMTNVTVVATGGIQNASRQYTWSWAGSGLSTVPTGLSLNTSTGVISGRPTVKGTYKFTITVRDAQNPANTDITSVLTWTVS